MDVCMLACVYVHTSAGLRPGIIGSAGGIQVRAPEGLLTKGACQVDETSARSEGADHSLPLIFNSKYLYVDI